MILSPRTCLCAGHYTDRWHRWRVLERGKRSTLYCLDCRAKWKSSAKYISLLPDHVPECRSGLSDSDVLKRILDGSLVVNARTAKVHSNGRQLTVIRREHPDGPQRGTYRFVNVCSQGKKKKVALHRLVWMAANKQVVPDGYDIDHINSQDDDTIGNLRLLESSENRSLGAKKARDGVLA